MHAATAPPNEQPASPQWRDVFILAPEALEKHRRGMALRVLAIAAASLVAAGCFAWQGGLARAVCFLAVAVFLAALVAAAWRRGKGHPTPRNIAVGDRAVRIDGLHLAFADVDAILVESSLAAAAGSLRDELRIRMRDGTLHCYDLGHHSAMATVFPEYRRFRLVLQTAFHNASGKDVATL